VERRIAASPETVFSYLIDPAKFVAWMGRGAELDPRPGGAFRLDVGSDNIASGSYLEVDPPHRLRFSWGWENHPTLPPGSTTVEITLRADGDGTVLTLRHLGLPDAGSRQLHADGWSQYTAQLAALFS
jgi:uncharacterized protein YndB with AHSA1/START domain